MNDDSTQTRATPPILADKHYDAPSAFTPENLLREARRQKSLEERSLPAVCLLDPDGDIVRRLVATGRAERCSPWACYHTDLYRFSEDGIAFGIVGCAVGASFAVLIAEEMFAAGCRLLVSMTSAGRIATIGEPPYFVLIECARRDEGTSYHYLPQAEYSRADPVMVERLDSAFSHLAVPVERGAACTTDAPSRARGCRVCLRRCCPPRFCWSALWLPVSWLACPEPSYVDRNANHFEERWPNSRRGSWSITTAPDRI